MKKYLTLALVVGLVCVCSTTVLASDDNDHGQSNGQTMEQGNGPNGPNNSDNGNGNHGQFGNGTDNGAGHGYDQGPGMGPGNGNGFGHRPGNNPGGGGSTGAPLDGGLLTILAASGVSYVVARKKKRKQA